MVKVKEDMISDFIEATRINAENSIKEPGIVKFDVIQNIDDPSYFVLIEIYRTALDSTSHKETSHYKIWRDTVEKMMAEPRHSIKYKQIFPQ